MNNIRLRQSNHSILARCLALLAAGGLVVQSVAPGFTAPVANTPTDTQAKAASNKRALNKEEASVRVDKRAVERALISRVEHRLSSSDLIGLVAGKQWAEISLDQAIQKALGQNITLARYAIQERVAAQSKIQAEAAFDPVLSSSFDISRNTKANRVDHVTTYHPPTTTCAYCEAILNGGGAGLPANDNRFIILDPSTSPQGQNVSPISFLHFTQARPNGLWEWTAVQASTKNPVPDPYISTYTISVDKPLPWGSEGFVAQSTTLKRAMAPLEYVAAGSSPYFVSYGLPWSSSLGGGFQVRPPWSKEFGPNSSREIGVKQGELGVKIAANTTANKQNSTINDVEQAFWNLVIAVHTLEAYSQNRQTMETLAAKTDRLMAPGVGKATEYDKIQVETQVAQARNLEATAASQLVLASNTLNGLLNFDRNVIFMPVGYSTQLAQKLDINLDDALAQGQSGNFDIRASDMSLASAGLTLHQRKQQVRPDVTLQVTTTAAQSNNPFGYRTYANSIGNLFDPDSMSVDSTLTYTYPIGNRLVKANLGSAREEESRLVLDRQKTANHADRLVLDAYIKLKSARERVLITKHNLDLAGTAYATAADMQEAGQITQYEVLIKSNDVLQARLRYVQSQINVKMAEASLLAAIGAMKKKRAGDNKSQASAQPAMQTAAIDRATTNLQGNDRP